jgi:uncharacterized membrane protein
MTTAARHPLVEDYLKRLWAEAARLPVDQARELVADIDEHLDVALTQDASEAEVRNVLERLGTPRELVSEAGAPTQEQRRSPVSPVAAIWFLVVAELTFILFPIAAVFWVVGLIFTFRATVWSQREKLLGLLVLGTGFPAAFFLMGVSIFAVSGCSQVYDNGRLVQDTCSGVDPATVVAWAVTLGYLALQAFTIWRLTRSARRR